MEFQLLRQMWRVFMLILLIISEICSDCDIVINEINSNDPTKPEKNEFIELARVCSGQPYPSHSVSLQGYKILGLSWTTTRGFTVNLVANLWNSKLHGKYFVFGGTGVDIVDLGIANGNVKSHTKFTKGSQSLYSFIQNANKRPAAIALVFDKSGLPDIDLSKQMPFLKLDNNITNSIKMHLKDLIIYGRRTSTSECQIFEFLHDDYAPGSRYLLRDFDAKLGPDYSLNRCGLEILPFSPKTYKLGKPTPGNDNDCTGIHFILDDHILEVMDPVNPIADHPHPTGCSSQIPAPIIQAIRVEAYEKAVQTQITAKEFGHFCPLELRSYDADLEDEIELSNTRKRKLNETTDDIQEWETTTHFKQEWLDSIEKYQRNLFPLNILKKPDVQVWFEYLPNEDNLTKSHFQCRLCNKYYDKFHLDTRYRPRLAAPFLGNKYDKNQEKIKEHPDLGGHREVVQQLKKRHQSQLENEFQMIQEKQEMEDEGYYKVTMRMIRSVFVEVKSNIPFDSHRHIVLLQKRNSLDMGIHHYEKNAAIRMTSSISEEMHNILLTSLISQGAPISVIVDSSTDTSGSHYLIVYFQTLEDERPILYFYRLILLDADESAVGLFRSFLNAVKSEKKDLYTYFSRKLIGFASDGASVMLGKNNGLIRKFEGEFNRTLYAVHCMAHRLHLALRKPFDKVQELVAFENTINAVHNFYNSKGHKRKAHLRAMSHTLGVDIGEIGYIFKERWISSEYTAIKQFQKSWLLIREDLEAISVDPEFNGDTKATATGLYKQIGSRLFVQILHFLLDLLFTFSNCNQEMQKKAGLLIGMEEVREHLLQTPREMTTRNGGNLIKFFNDVKCSETTRGACTENQFMTSESVKWKGKELMKSKSYLGNFRSDFMDTLIEEINTYFPLGKLSAFQVFDPKNIPSSTTEVSFYGSQELVDLCNIFGWQFYSLWEDWQTLLRSLITHQDFCRQRLNAAQTFWSFFLKKTDVAWTENSKNLIRTVMVLPIGSADAERGFSVMNHIRGSRRSRLLPENLDKIMRIRINGPDKLEEFPAARYTKAWVKANHMRSDDPQQRGKRPKLDLEEGDGEDGDKQYFPKSTLF